MKLLTIFILTLITTPLCAQDDETLQQDTSALEKIKAARAAYITERLALTPQEAEKFWPLYNAYSQKRNDLKRQYRKAKKSGQDEKTLLDLGLKLEQQKLDLEKDFYNQMNEVISAQKLIKLREAEIDFRKIILQQIQQRKGQGRGKNMKE